MAKQLTAHAATSKSIRAGLKKLNIKLVSVRGKSYAGGNSVTVEVQDLSPAQYKLAHSLVEDHQYGRFDGMNDSYDYSNEREDIPQVKYTFISNTFSDEMYDKALAVLTPENTIGLDIGEIPSSYSETRDNYKLRELIQRILSGRDSCNFFSKMLWSNEELGLTA